METRKIKAKYASVGTVRGTARILGISIYEVEKALGIGRCSGKKKMAKSPLLRNKISEERLLEETDEEIGGRKRLSMCLKQIGKKEYVPDADMRRECKVGSDSIWDKLSLEYKKNVIVVGFNVKPKIYWGDDESCENLVNSGKASFLY